MSWERPSVLAAILATVVLAAACGQAGRARSPALTTGGGSSAAAARTSPLPSPTIPTVPPNVCGAWSATSSPQAQAILAAYGSIDSCELLGRTWVVTAISTSRPGQVGLQTCRADDTACMNGALPHDLEAFAWVSAPRAVGAGLKRYAGTGPVLIFSTARHGQVSFNIRTRSFTRWPRGICHW